MNKKIRKASKNDNLCNQADNLINKPSLFFSSSLAMFRDYKSGGYNLEGSKANTVRLTNLILLIAIAYTSACLEGKSFKHQGHQKYITRLTEAQRKYRRHSDFRVGLYGCNWVIAWDFCFLLVEKLMRINRHKLNYYQQGLKVLSSLS